MSTFEFNPYYVIGYRKNGDPIYLIAGGSEDADQFDVDADADDADDSVDDGAADDQDDTGDDDDDSANETQADNKVDRAELNKVIKQRQDLKKRLREAEKKAKDLELSNESEAEKARREAAEEAAEKATAKYKPALVKKHVESKLLESGVQSNKINRLIKLMDMDEIDLDDDLNVEGAEDQIDILQEEYPELFGGAKDDEPEDKPAPRKKVPKADSSDRKPAPKKKSTTDVLWEGLTRGR